MLTCIPQSICSWNYRIQGTSAGDARLTFGRVREKGTLVLGGEHFEIRKGGVFSRTWTLEQDGRTVAEATKKFGPSRTFTINAGGNALTLRAASIFSRRFEIRVRGQVAGTIRPAHMFTRRAFIECRSLPDHVVLFCFWLVVLTWKRASNAGQGASAAS